jgi:hypothetical protein
MGRLSNMNAAYAGGRSIPNNKKGANLSRLESTILRRAGEATHVKVAAAIGKDPATMSRIFSNQTGLMLCDLENFLKELGLTVVELGADVVHMPAEEARALKVLARKALRFEETTDV